MSIRHDYYEGLCALAVAGQIAHDELATLQEHTETCDECRSALADFRHIVAQVLPEYATEHFPVQPPWNMTSRFVARARTEGIPLIHSLPPRNRRRWLPSFTLVAELVSAAVLVVLGWNFVLSHWRSSHRPSQAGVPPRNLVEPNAPTSNDWEKQLQALQDHLSQTTDQLAAKQKELEATKSDAARLTSRLLSLEQADMQLRHKLAERDVQLTDAIANRDQLTADLEKVRSAKATQDFALQADQSELHELRVEVTSLTDQINEGEQLSAAAEQAKDLIVARNLHIVDVHDNANGNRPRPFGRIFYTEGKKLIFYAYDLGAMNAKVTFWVWGEKSGTTEQARHLGILHADDKRDGRWVITFDDRQVLAQINTVFVTAESPKKEPTKPSSNRILVAFLGGSPNHP